MTHLTIVARAAPRSLGEDDKTTWNTQPAMSNAGANTVLLIARHACTASPAHACYANVRARLEHYITMRDADFMPKTPM